MKKILLVSLCMAVQIFSCMAQSNWVYYNSDNSPLTNNLISIAVDQENNVWGAYAGADGTDNGVVKFDGQHWINYNVSNSGLPNNDIRDIAVDPYGNIWFACYNAGVVKFDGASWTRYHTGNSGIGGDGIVDIEFDTEGHLWVGAYFNGVSTFDGENWQTYSNSNAPFPESNCINDLSIDKENNVWVGLHCGGGMAKFSSETKSWTSFTTSNSDIPDHTVVSLVADTAGVIWASHTNVNVSSFDGSTWTTYDAPRAIDKFAIDKIGTLWGCGDGLSKFENGMWYKMAAPAKADTVYAFDIAVSSDGSLYMSTYSGLWFNHIDTLNDLNRQPVFHIADITVDRGFETFKAQVIPAPVLETEKDQIVTYKLINFHEEKITITIDSLTGEVTFTSFPLTFGKAKFRIVANDHQQVNNTYEVMVTVTINPVDPPLPPVVEGWINFTIDNSPLLNDYITTLTVDHENNLWAAYAGRGGTTGDGVAKFDGQHWRHYNVSNSGLPNDDIRDIAVDPYGNIWFACYYAGIVKFDGATWTRYYTGNSGIAGDNIGDIEFDGEGHLWVGAYFNGVSTFDGENWQTYSYSNAPFTEWNCISDLSIDRANNVWVGLDCGGGMAKFSSETKSWTSFTTSNSDIPNHTVVSLVADTAGVIWASHTNVNVSSFDGSTWTTYDAPRAIDKFAIDKTGTLWGCGDGLSKFENGMWYKMAAPAKADTVYAFDIAVSSDGSLYMSTYSGLWFNHIDTLNNLNRQPVFQMADIAVDRGFKTFKAQVIPAPVFETEKDQIVTYKLFNFNEEKITITIDSLTGEVTFTSFPLTFGTAKFKIVADDHQQVNNTYEVMVTVTINPADPPLPPVVEGWINLNKDNSPLLNNIVTSLALDQQNNLWISYGGAGGLGNGVTKFDGQHWINYNVSNSGLPNNDIRDIAVDPYGNIWFACYHAGIVKFDGATWTRYHTGNSGIAGDNIGDIEFDGEGHLWVGAYFNGVSTFDGENWQTYSNSNAPFPESNCINDLSIDKENNVWVGLDCGGGMAKFSSKTKSWTSFTTSNSDLPDHTVVSLVADTAGVIWASHINVNVSSFDGSTWTTYDAPRAIDKFCVDEQGTLWGYGQGLFKFSNGEWSEVNIPLEAASTYSLCLAAKAEETLWLGTYTGLWKKHSNTSPATSSEDYLDNQVQFFPNPFTSTLSYQKNGLRISSGMIILHDMMGREVKRFTLSDNQADVDVSMLPSGMYLAQLKHNKGVTKLQKLIKK